MKQHTSSAERGAEPSLVSASVPLPDFWRLMPEDGSSPSSCLLLLPLVAEPLAAACATASCLQGERNGRAAFTACVEALSTANKPEQSPAHGLQRSPVSLLSLDDILPRRNELLCCSSHLCAVMLDQFLDLAASLTGLQQLCCDRDLF